MNIAACVYKLCVFKICGKINRSQQNRSIWSLSNFEIYKIVLLTLVEALKFIATHGSGWPCPKQALMTCLQRAFQDKKHIYENKYGSHQIKNCEVIFKNPWL